MSLCLTKFLLLVALMANKVFEWQSTVSLGLEADKAPELLAYKTEDLYSVTSEEVRIKKKWLLYYVVYATVLWIVIGAAIYYLNQSKANQVQNHKSSCCSCWQIANSDNYNGPQIGWSHCIDDGCSCNLCNDQYETQDDPVGGANADFLKLKNRKQYGDKPIIQESINFKHDDSNSNICYSQIVHPDKSTTHISFPILHKAVSAKLHSSKRRCCLITMNSSPCTNSKLCSLKMCTLILSQHT